MSWRRSSLSITGQTHEKLTITNCQIVRFPAVLAASHKLQIRVSVRLLTIKISHWAREKREKEKKCFFFKIQKRRFTLPGLKLLVAVHSSFAEILICQLRVCHFWRRHGNHKFHLGLAKNQLIWHIIITLMPKALCLQRIVPERIILFMKIVNR